MSDQTQDAAAQAAAAADLLGLSTLPPASGINTHGWPSKPLPSVVARRTSGRPSRPVSNSGYQPNPWLLPVLRQQAEAGLTPNDNIDLFHCGPNFAPPIDSIGRPHGVIDLTHPGRSFWDLPALHAAESPSIQKPSPSPRRPLTPAEVAHRRAWEISVRDRHVAEELINPAELAQANRNGQTIFLLNNGVKVPIESANRLYEKGTGSASISMRGTMSPENPWLSYTDYGRIDEPQRLGGYDNILKHTGQEFRGFQTAVGGLAMGALERQQALAGQNKNSWIAALSEGDQRRVSEAYGTGLLNTLGLLDGGPLGWAATAAASDNPGDAVENLGLGEVSHGLYQIGGEPILRGIATKAAQAAEHAGGYLGRAHELTKLLYPVLSAKDGFEAADRLSQIPIQQLHSIGAGTVRTSLGRNLVRTTAGGRPYLGWKVGPDMAYVSPDDLQFASGRKVRVKFEMADRAKVGNYHNARTEAEFFVHGGPDVGLDAHRNGRIAWTNKYPGRAKRLQTWSGNPSEDSGLVFIYAGAPETVLGSHGPMAAAAEVKAIISKYQVDPDLFVKHFNDVRMENKWTRKFAKRDAKTIGDVYEAFSENAKSFRRGKDSFTARKEFVKEFFSNSPEARVLHLPTVDEVIHNLEDPESHNLKTGDLMAALRVETNPDVTARGTFRILPHPIYPETVNGINLGRIRGNLNLQELLPNIFNNQFYSRGRWKLDIGEKGDAYIDLQRIIDAITENGLPQRMPNQ